MRNKRFFATLTLVFYTVTFAVPSFAAQQTNGLSTAELLNSDITKQAEKGFSDDTDTSSSLQNQQNRNKMLPNANSDPDTTIVRESLTQDGPLDRRNRQRNIYYQNTQNTQNTLQQRPAQFGYPQEGQLQQSMPFNPNIQGLQTEQNVVVPVRNSENMDPKEISASSMFNNLIGGLPRFGVEFFEQRRVNDLTYAPVGDGYVVAPGDEIKVTLWGFNEIKATLIVDRDGMLTLPQAGVISVGGLTFGELRREIDSAYRRILTDFELNVSAGKLHTINVYVAGNVNTPGAYAVSSMASVLDVLSMAGGSSLSGSMRSIQIKRGAKKIADFDVYRLLLHGDRKNDVRLHDGDVIFVPPVGNLIAVTGNVKRPAVYEIGDGATMNDAIRLAGGITSGAFKGRVQIVRVKDNTVRTSFEADLSDASKKQKLHDGDLIKIFAVPGEAFTVRLAGAVQQPGIFAVDPGKTTLRELISRAGGLLYTASDTAEITSMRVSEHGPVTSRRMLNIKDELSGAAKTLLQRDDYVFVRTVPDWDTTRSARIEGRVLYPGEYAVKRGEKLSSLLERCGGYGENAFLRGAVFMRDSVRIEQQKAIDEMIIRLEREFAAASNEAVSSASSVKDKDFALAEIQQKQRLLESLRNTKATGRIIVNFPEKFTSLKGTALDIEIKDGDRIIIPERPNTVQVVGAVTAQSAFIYQPELKLKDYINLAGGFSASANAKKAYIIRANGSIVKAYSGSSASRIEEGDYIVIPEKMVFTQRLRTASDILDLLSKTVLSIASVHYIFK